MGLDNDQARKLRYPNYGPICDDGLVMSIKDQCYL